MDLQSAASQASLEALQQAIVSTMDSKLKTVETKITAKLTSDFTMNSSAMDQSVQQLQSLRLQLQLKLDDQSEKIAEGRIALLESKFQIQLNEQSAKLERGTGRMEQQWEKFATKQAEARHSDAARRIDDAVTKLAHAQPSSQVVYRERDRGYRVNGFSEDRSERTEEKEETQQARYGQPSQPKRQAASNCSLEWEEWVPKQIMAWMDDVGCGPLGQLLFPPDAHTNPPIVIKHGSQLKLLASAGVLTSIGANDDVALSFAKRTFQEAAKKLFS